MKNIHILPTDKSSRLTIMEGKLLLSNFVSWESKSIDWEYGDGINQNIYITSDEEIKEGDWFTDDNNSLKTSYKLSHVQFANPKKIILTTDQSLDGVQAIDDEFLEWFVKNPSCEWVKVRKNPKVHFIVKGKGVKGFNQGYKIIIPKEEPKYTTSNLDNDKYKDYSVAKERAANYMSLKGALDSQYVDFSNPNADKITSASTTTIKEEPKPQTLEEVTKQIQNECHNFTKLVVPNVSYQDATNTFLFMKLAELTLKINKMTAKEPKQGLNLSLLEQKLDKALSNETEESLNTWLKEKRDKQETLEEASQKFAYNYFEMNEINHYKALKQGFVAGAKWQQVKTEIENL